jgi:hypothetical protein
MEPVATENDFIITFVLRTGYLYAHVKGDRDSYEISKAYWQAVAEECARRNVRKVLVEEDLAGRIESMNEIFQGASQRVYQGFSGVKIAFVDRHPGHHEDNVFGELVATNRGLFCKVFSDLSEGETWLLSD